MGCFQAKVGKFVSSPFVVQQVRRFCDFSAFAAESGGALDFLNLIFNFFILEFAIHDLSEPLPLRVSSAKGHREMLFHRRAETRGNRINEDDPVGLTVL